MRKKLSLKLLRNCLEPSSTELFSFGEESKEVWNHRACSSIGCDLDALTEEHRLKRGFRLSEGIDRFWTRKPTFLIFL